VDVPELTPPEPVQGDVGPVRIFIDAGPAEHLALDRRQELVVHRVPPPRVAPTPVAPTPVGWHAEELRTHRAEARFLACTFRFARSLVTEARRSYFLGSSVNNGEQPNLAPVFYGPYDPYQHKGGRVYTKGRR
jgi:hypothetical protein